MLNILLDFSLLNIELLNIADTCNLLSFSSLALN